MDKERLVKGNAKVQTYKGAYISIADKGNSDICDLILRARSAKWP